MQTCPQYLSLWTILIVQIKLIEPIQWFHDGKRVNKMFSDWNKKLNCVISICDILVFVLLIWSKASNLFCFLFITIKSQIERNNLTVSVALWVQRENILTRLKLCGMISNATKQNFANKCRLYEASDHTVSSASVRDIWVVPEIVPKIVPKIVHEIVHKTYLASIIQCCQYTVCKYSSTATQTDQNVRLDFFDDLW